MNDDIPAVPDASSLARQAVERYCSESRQQTFGEWVLQTFYSQLDYSSLSRMRDFCGAQRTTDGKFYLIGMLSRGTLPAQPLRDALAV